MYADTNNSVILPQFAGRLIGAVQTAEWFGPSVALRPYLNADSAYDYAMNHIAYNVNTCITCTSGPASPSNNYRIPAFQCPSEVANGSTMPGSFNGDRYSYCVNGYLNSTAANGQLVASFLPYKTHSFPNPGQKVFAADAHAPFFQNQAWAHWNFTWYGPVGQNFPNMVTSPASAWMIEHGAAVPPFFPSGIATFHEGGRNAVFLDGHAEWITTGTFWRPLLDPNYR